MSVLQSDNETSNRLESYYKIARMVALESPCARRKYGTVIGYNSDPVMVIGVNRRVTRACNDACIRNRAGIMNGSRTELGAEVHAEQAALIDAPRKGDIFLNAAWGYNHQQELVELFGVDCYPCLTCARMIKYAGYRYVYLKESASLPIKAIHIEDIILNREQALGPHYE